MIALGIPALSGEDAGGGIVDGYGDGGRRGLIARRVPAGSPVNVFEEAVTGIEAATAFENVVAPAAKERINAGILECPPGN